MFDRKARSLLVCVMSLVAVNGLAGDEVNLFSASPDDRIVLVVSNQPDALQRYAQAELTGHIKRVTGAEPEVIQAADLAEHEPRDANLLILGQPDSNLRLKRLADGGFFHPNESEQGFSLRIDVNPRDPQGRRWLAVLSGADSRGVL